VTILLFQVDPDVKFFNRLTTIKELARQDPYKIADFQALSSSTGVIQL